MTKTEDDHSFASWLAWVGIQTCTCDFRYANLGRLDRFDMGKGWVRISTNPTCEHHGIKAEKERKDRHDKK